MERLLEKRLSAQNALQLFADILQEKKDDDYTRCRYSTF